MTREKLNYLQPIENVFEIECYSNKIMQKMWDIQEFHYLYETSDVCARVATLRNDKLVMQEEAIQIIDQLKNSLDKGMCLQLETAMNRHGYERIMNRVPEDSAMHVICRLHVVVRRLNVVSEELANKIQHRLEQEDEEEELDVVVDDASQELAGVASDMDIISFLDDAIQKA
jgi:hypothetical protein